MAFLRNPISRADFFIATGLAMLTIAVYFRVVWFDFINYDDPFFVVANENVRNGLTFRGVRSAFTTPYESSWIPLTWISYMIDVQLFGVNAGAHHLVNALIHTVNSMLLFFFLSITTTERWKSAMVALLFALHPLHVESVAWVAERKDVLSAFFWMLTLCSYIYYVRSPGIFRFIVSLVFFLLGLLAKPMLVTLPLVLLMIDAWPLKRHETSNIGGSTKITRMLAEKVPFVILTVAVSVITYMINKEGGVITENYTFLSRTGKAATYYVAYLAKMLWPSGLSVFYPVSLYPPSIVKVSVSVTLLLAISIAVFFSGELRRCLMTGWSWYLVTLIPVIGLIQVGGHAIADRYTYIPLVGIFIMLVWGIPELIGSWHLKKTLLNAVSIIIVVAMMVVTSLQLRHWQNSITLFSHAALVTERNHVAHNNLGYALQESGRMEEAIANFKLAAEERPADTFAYFNLGDIYMRIGEYEEALDAYSRVLMFDPSNDRALHAIGLLYIDTDRMGQACQKYQLLAASGSQLADELLKEILRKSKDLSCFDYQRK